MPPEIFVILKATDLVLVDNEDIVIELFEFTCSRKSLKSNLYLPTPKSLLGVGGGKKALLLR